MNRVDRLVAKVRHLEGRRIVRAEELAQKFEISERTVYRDIVALGEAGVPVMGETGVGYRLAPGYHLPPVMFTADEALAMAGGRGPGSGDDGCPGLSTEARSVGQDPVRAADDGPRYFGAVTTGDVGVDAEPR
jgi:biotin operon repressor